MTLPLFGHRSLMASIPVLRDVAISNSSSDADLIINFMADDPYSYCPRI